MTKNYTCPKCKLNINIIGDCELLTCKKCGTLIFDKFSNSTNTTKFISLTLNKRQVNLLIHILNNESISPITKNETDFIDMRNYINSLTNEGELYK